MGIIKKRLRISKMSCVNCQNKIEKKLRNTAGVQKVKVSYRTGFADIVYDSALITQKDIKTTIEKLGYGILPETEEAGTDVGKNVSLLVVIVLLYALLQQFGILNLLVPGRLADTGMGYGMLFVVGLLTSVHCIAMCGGIHLSQCIPRKEQENSGKLASLEAPFLYNLGRVISYTVIGFFLGFLGMLLGGDSGAGISVFLQGIIKMIAGILMVIMGINMLELFPCLRRFQPQMPGFLAAKLGGKKAAARRPLLVGLLNGLMPCGPLQSMQIVALASGNPFSGALSMLLFSLGTTPLMLGLGSLVSALGKRFAQKAVSAGAVLVTVLGLSMLSQGGSLSGILLPDRLFAAVLVLCAAGVAASFPFPKKIYRDVSVTAVIAIMLGGVIVWNHSGKGASPNETSAAASLNEAAAAGETETTDEVQVINSTLELGRYPSITVQAGIPVKWVIDAPAGTINGCNYKMLLKEYGIQHTFTEGENIIEFTPEKEGTVQYTCWMGMIRGTIIVTEGNE